MEKFLLWYVGRPRMLELHALILVAILALTSGGLTGCAQTMSMRDVQTALATAANQQVPMPHTADVKCDGPPLPVYTDSAGQALAEARSYGVLSVGAIGVCDLRRQLAVDAINLHNQGVWAVVNQLRPLGFWEKIFGRRKAR